jgi:hypothetical protein
MLIRTIATTSRIRSIQLADCLSSLFALELFTPSPVYYVISPWITDFIVMSNGFGQFRALLPERVEHQIRFSMLLSALQERGAKIFILTRPDSDDFLDRLPQSPNFHIRKSEQLHEKSLVCHSFAFNGSMNLTHTGTHESDEQIQIITERQSVDRAYLAAETRWNNAL